MSTRQLLVDELAAPVEVDAEPLELGLDVTGADADDGAPAREVVEGGELLGGDERVAVGEHVRVREQVGAFGDARASHESVPMQSCQYVPMREPSDSGSAMWSHTPT